MAMKLIAFNQVLSEAQPLQDVGLLTNRSDPDYS
jgi:hypothetical protein